MHVCAEFPLKFTEARRLLMDLHFSAKNKHAMLCVRHVRMNHRAIPSMRAWLRLFIGSLLKEFSAL